MQRALWKGAISFGLVHIPVELFSAEKRNELDLTMLDSRDFSPIGYKRVNKKTGKEVEWENIVKGYEYDEDQYVVLSEEDLKRANVKATQTIDILAFVQAGRIPFTFYEQPYYLVPDKGGDKVYALLLRRWHANLAFKGVSFCFSPLKIAWMAIFRGNLKPSEYRLISAY